jgi:hypothetical protein
MTAFKERNSGLLGAPDTLKNAFSRKPLHCVTFSYQQRSIKHSPDGSIDKLIVQFLSKVNRFLETRIRPKAEFGSLRFIVW